MPPKAQVHERAIISTFGMAGRVGRFIWAEMTDAVRLYFRPIPVFYGYLRSQVARSGVEQVAQTFRVTLPSGERSAVQISVSGPIPGGLDISSLEDLASGVRWYREGMTVVDEPRDESPIVPPDELPHSLEGESSDKLSLKAEVEMALAIRKYLTALDAPGLSSGSQLANVLRILSSHYSSEIERPHHLKEVKDELGEKQ